jgi:diacylglycerol kinase family enzyme
MKKIGVFVNPAAKALRKKSSSVIEEFKKIGGDLVDVRACVSYEDNKKAIAEMKKSGVSCVAITGGDGTIHHIISEVINVWPKNQTPPILLLKGGTMNNIARSAGVKGSPRTILSKYIKAVKEGREVSTFKRNTMKVGGKYCFLFGVGMTTNFLNAAYEGNKGFVKNAEVIFRAIKEGITDSKDSKLFRRLKASVKVDGKDLDLNEVLAILSGTVEGIGMGFTPMPDANKYDGKFHLMVSGNRPIEVVKQIMRLKSGKALLGENNYNGAAGNLVIKSPGVFQYTMDGDIYDADGSITVEGGPGINLIRI